MKPVVWLFFLILCIIPFAFFGWTVTGPYQGMLANLLHHGALTANSLSHLGNEDGRHAAVLLFAIWFGSVCIMQIGIALKKAH
ncbi:MAG: hypothetical protein HZC01_00590 [Candidatus Kerfeldbacteria bacterium]|nr:hypothetical protein [Candidatus Kerfeldbacteria bacterium]